MDALLDRRNAGLPRRGIGLGFDRARHSGLVRLTLLLLLLTAFLAPTFAEGPGLIDQPQTFPWSVGMTPSAQEEAGGLAPQTYRIKTSVLWFNTYRQYGLGAAMEQQVDMEGLLGTVSAAWSPAPGWELRGQVQGWTLGGGIMDYALSGFHGVFGFANQGRDQVADGAYRDYLQGAFDLKTPPSGITQASGAVRGFAGPWSWTVWVKLPVPGQPDWGWSDRWGGGAGAGWGEHWKWADWGFGAGLTAALVFVPDDPIWVGPTGGAVPQINLYTTADVPRGFRSLVEATFTPVPRTGAGYLDQGAGLLTCGFQFPWGHEWTFETALTEEFCTWATNEVGFQFGLTWNP